MKKLVLVAAPAAAIVVVLSGCFGSSGSSLPDSASDSGRAQPVVEAFIEYPGPNSRWAGPVPVLLHVTARDEGLARVEILPEAFNSWQAAPGGDARGIASLNSGGATVGGEHQGSAIPGVSTMTATNNQEIGAHPLTADAARENLADFEKSFANGDVEFHGCLYPVRARLVHADGKVTEKQGCRGVTGWSKSVSDATSWFMASATHPSYVAALHAIKPAAVTVPAPGAPAEATGGNRDSAKGAPPSVREPGVPVRNGKADSMAKAGEPAAEPKAENEGHGRVPAAEDVGEPKAVESAE